MIKYYLENLDDEIIYKRFIKIMVRHSDAFSFVQVRYTEKDKVKKSVKEIKKLLKPYKIYAKNVVEWPGTPGTIAFKDGGIPCKSVYRIYTYRCREEVISALNKASIMRDWDYPDFPMDLAFYRNGYAWFFSVAHEQIYRLFLNKKEDCNILNELNEAGVVLSQYNGKFVEEPYYDRILSNI